MSDGAPQRRELLPKRQALEPHTVSASNRRMVRRKPTGVSMRDPLADQTFNSIEG